MKSGCFRLAFLVVVLLSVASFRFNSNHRLSSSRIEMAHKDFAKLAIAASLLTSNPLVASAAIGPLGNLGAAFNAYKQNPDSVWCNLDNQSIKEGESSCQQLDNVVRYRAGKLITVRQDWGGSASTGSAIWNGANMATWFLENRIGADSVKGNSVLELGAGVGFTSLVANIMGAQDVVITDGNEDVLKLADMNILLNSDNSDAIGVEGIDGSPIRTIRTARLQWNTDDEKALSISESTKRPWDYIFASDLTYKKAAWGDLLACISHLSGPNTKIILSMEPRNIGEVEGVAAFAVKNGLRMEEQQLPISILDKEKSMCGVLCARLFVLTKI